MKKILYLSIIILLSTEIVAAQITSINLDFKCGTQHNSNDRNNTGPADTHQVILGGSGVNEFCVRLRLHKIARTDSTGAVTDGFIYNALNSLNSRFDFPDSSDNISFNWNTSINIIADDDIYNSNLSNDGSYDFSLLPNNDMIDIYFFNKTLSNATGSIFGSADGIADGTKIVLSNNVTSSKIIAHEIGHVLGLFHTNHSTRGGGSINPENDDGYGSHSDLVECPGNIGSDSLGDFIRDTPGDPGGALSGEDPLVNNCEFSPSGFNDTPNYCDSMSDLKYNPSANLSNYMRSSASDGWSMSCWTSFSIYQGFRMKGVLSNATMSDFSHIAVVLCENEQENEGNDEDQQTCDSSIKDVNEIISSIYCYPLGQPYPYRFQVPNNFNLYSEIKIVTNSGQEIDLLNSQSVGLGVKEFSVNLYQDIFDEAILQMYGPNSQLCLEKAFYLPGTCRSQNESILLFPNPVKGGSHQEISIDSKIKRVEIYDIYGKLQAKELVRDSKFNMFTENLGLYIIKGFDRKDNLVLSEKIIVN